MRTSDHADFDTTRARLRSKDVQHPFTAVSSLGLDLESILDVCRAYEPLLRPGEAFSHSTAALLYGAPLPHAAADIRPLHVLSPGVTRARTVDTIGHRSASAFPIALRYGLPVVTAPDMWIQVAGMLRREDLAAVGDYLVTGRRFGNASEGPLCSLGDLVAAVHSNNGRRGLRGARWAVDLIRVGAASRPESLLRLLIVAAGLPEPEIGPAVALARGTIVLHPDLAYPDLRIAIEYEGSGHRNADRWERDIERRELFEDAGWRVIRVTNQGLFDAPEATVRRIRHARIARTRR